MSSITQMSRTKGVDDHHLPQTEVVPRARRRSFSAAYKRRVLHEADGLTEPGQIGALLRREGLYHSHLHKWRRWRDAGGLVEESSYAAGMQAENVRLRRELERAERRLERAEAIIEVQKKVYALLGLEEAPSGGSR
jgi:transposase